MSSHKCRGPRSQPELHGLPLGVPAGVLGDGAWETVPLALSWSVVQSNKEHALLGGGPGSDDQLEERAATWPASSSDATPRVYVPLGGRNNGVADPPRAAEG